MSMSSRHLPQQTSTSKSQKRRKFGLGLTLAHQNLRQLEDFSRFSGQVSTRLKDAILGNVMNLVTFGSSQRDNEELSSSFDIDANAISQLPRFAAMVRAMHGDDNFTYSVTIPVAEADIGSPDARATVRRREQERGRVLPRTILAEAIEAREQKITELVNKGGQPTTETRDTHNPFLDEWLSKRRTGAPPPKPTVPAGDPVNKNVSFDDMDAAPHRAPEGNLKTREARQNERHRDRPEVRRGNLNPHLRAFWGRRALGANRARGKRPPATVPAADLQAAADRPARGSARS